MTLPSTRPRINITLALAQNGEDQLRELAASIQDTIVKLTALYVQHAKLAAILDLQSQLNLQMQENPRNEQQAEATDSEALRDGSEGR